MPGLYRDRARFASGVTDDDAAVARALNNALTARNFAAADDVNLASLLSDHFGQNSGGIIPQNPDDGDYSSDEESMDTESLDFEEPMDIEDNDFELVVPNVAADVMGLHPKDMKEGVAAADMADDWCSHDNNEELMTIRDFKCKCSQPCLDQFEATYILQLRAQMTDGGMTVNERKMFLMGRISATIHRGRQTKCSKRTDQKDRQRPRTVFMVDGLKVCRAAFMFMHKIGDTRLRSITKSYLDNGVTPPTSAAGGRKANKNSLTEADHYRVMTFLTNYADQQGLLIPGRISGVKASDPRIRLLPCSDTKTSVWRKYEEALSKQNSLRRDAGLSLFRIMKRTTFLGLWKRLCPFIITTRPRSDLCWQCQQNNSAVYQSANLTEEEKMQRLQKQEQHLAHVAAERNLYRDMVSAAKTAVEEGNTDTMHYSFDFAQQLQYPFNPDQPGPMYFLCPRKCGLFGVACDGSGVQVNYLIDEGMTTSKGSNSVISYLHDYFQHFGLGENVAQLHCDNCGGQNKNKFVMWYLAWRTMYGLHNEISVHFMVSGHTKFSPDRGFGLIKHLYKRKMVSSLSDISDMVKESSVRGLNQPRLVGLEDGTTNVPCYDWQTFLAPYFTPLAGIKKYHHMRFHRDHPGVAFVKVFPDDEEKEIHLLRSPTSYPPRHLPDPLIPPGLSQARKEYLFRHIREYCATSARDTVCPPVPQMPNADLDSDDEL